MTSVLVSPTFQITIPKAIREALDIQPGQKIQVFQYQKRVELIPVIPIERTRGFLQDIDTSVSRESDRI